MSAFDDEFGLFGDETSTVEEDERRSTLGARTIASGETIIDDVEPEDERPARRRRGGFPETREGEAPGAGEGGRWQRRRAPLKRDPLPAEIAHPRAVELLTFLAKKLVANPAAVVVELHPDAHGAVLELEVDPEDIGKVIGRGGRVAQALRTIVRAGAEGRVTIDIVDADEDEEDDLEDSDDEDEGTSATAAPLAREAVADDAREAIADDTRDVVADALLEGQEAADVRIEGPLRGDSEPPEFQEP